MFSTAIERAIRVAFTAHEGQTRKGTATPYATHPVHVALMLARWGLDEDVIVAGLLHDVVEDSAAWTLDRVRKDFGGHVASIVDQLTEDKSRSWEERKRWAVEHVPGMSPEAATVKAVDKLHNLQCLLATLRESADADAVWSRFNGGRVRTLEMSRELVEVLAARVDPKIARALRATCDALEEEAGRPQGSGVPS